MKRMLLVAALVAIANFVQAQQPTSRVASKDRVVSITCEQSCSVRELVFKIATDEKLNITGLSRITGQWDGNLNAVPLQKAFDELARDQPYKLTLEDNTIGVTSKPGAVTPPPSPTSQQPVLQPSTPTTHMDAAEVEERVQRNIFGDRLYEQIQAENARPRPILPIVAPSPILPQDPASIEMRVQQQMFGPMYPYFRAQQMMPYRYGASGYIYSSGYGWYPDPWLIRFFDDRCNQRMYGLFKIDGPDRQHQDIRVLVDDLDKGPASKYDQKHNGAIIVRVRDVCDPPADQPPPEKTFKLQFTKEKKNENPVRVTRFTRIEPFEVTGFHNMMWQRVTNDTFKGAEIVDPLQQQHLPDSLEGGPVPSVKLKGEEKK